MSHSELREQIRKELICELESSAHVRKNDDGSYDVNIGNGLIKFTINPPLSEGLPDIGGSQ